MGVRANPLNQPGSATAYKLWPTSAHQRNVYIHVNDSHAGFYMFTGIVMFLFSGPDASSTRHDKMMFGGLLVLLYTSFIVAVVLTAHFNS